MKAMILAAGKGTRLGEITQHTPKCLVDIGGITMLEHVVERLKAVGVTSLVINLFHLKDKVRAFVEHRHGFGLPVHFSDESVLLGTGGGVKAARAFLDGPKSFLVHNADIYCEGDLAPLLHQHEERRAMATLGVLSRPTSRYLLFQGGGLCGWENTKQAEKLTVHGAEPYDRLGFSGIHIIHPRFFQYLDRYTGEFSIIPPYLDAVSAGEKVQSWDMGGRYWLDMGKVEQLEELRKRRNA